MLNRFLLVAGVVGFFCSLSGAKPTEQQKKEAEQTAADLKLLQGHWLLERVEQNGGTNEQPFNPREAIYIENSKVTAVTKRGEIRDNSTEADLVIEPWKSPKTVEVRVTAGFARHRNWLAIYKIDGNRLIVATKNFDKDQAPGLFSTKLTAGAERATHILTYKRVAKEPAADTPPRQDEVKKPTAREEEQAVANDLKALQGHWLLVKKEANGNRLEWPFHPDQGIFIEKNRITAVTKRGQILDESRTAEFSLEPLKNQKSMDIVMDEGRRRGQTWLAIYRIEGDTLTIAVNQPSDSRPARFATNLAAGSERAVFLVTYRRAPKD